MQPAKGSRSLSGFHLCSPVIYPSCKSDVISTRAFLSKPCHCIYLWMCSWVYQVWNHIISRFIYCVFAQLNYCLLHWLHWWVCGKVFKTAYLFLNGIYICVFVLFITSSNSVTWMYIYWTWCCTKSFAVLSCICNMNWKYTAGNSVLHCWVIIHYIFV